MNEICTYILQDVRGRKVLWKKQNGKIIKKCGEGMTGCNFKY